MSLEISKKRSFEFHDLFWKTNKKRPLKEDVTAFREMISSDPTFCAGLLPLAQTTAEDLVSRVTMTPGAKEILRANLLSTREELGYRDAPTFERALIDHVALCWLRLQIVEQWYSTATQSAHTTESGLYLEKRLTMVQKRFLRAIETLAKVRRLVRGLTIVNIAGPGSEQTVNQVIQNT